MKANAQPEIVTKNGKPVSVILPIKKYQEMLERLEDAADVAWLKRATQKTSFPSIGRRACRSTNALGEAMYRVVVERSAEKDLRKLQLDVRFRVADALRSLANDPRPVGSRKLAGTKHDWRVRVGDYRIIYEIADAIRVVRIYRVRHRREAYR